MKKCVFLMCALFLGAGALAGANRGGAKVARADAPKTDFQYLNKVLADFDFEDLELGATDVFDATGFWSDGSIKVVESNGSKAIEFKNVGAALGGIRSDFYGDFVDGKTYRVEFDSVIESETGVVQIDFHETNYWTSFFVTKNSAYKNPSGNDTVKNVQWVNGHVTLDIVSNPGNHWFSIYNSGLGENETFIVDNFKIYSVETETFHQNFGTNLNQTYLENFASLESATLTSGQKVAHFYNNNSTAASWPVMYFNQLPAFEAGHQYRIVIGYAEAPVYDEYYINMVGNWGGHTTFSIRKDGSQYKDNDVDDCTLVHSSEMLVIDFNCVAALSEQQIRFCVYANTGTDMDFKFSEFTIYDLNKVAAREEAIATYKDTAKDQLDNWKTAHLAEYREAQQTLITDDISSAETAIDAAVNEAAVDEIVTKLFEDLAEIKTAAQYEAEEAAAALEQAKTAAKAELASYVDENDYYEAEWTTIQTIISEANSGIDNASTIEDVENYVAFAKLLINLEYTKAQKDLRTAMDNARNALDATDLTAYREAERAQVKELIAAGKGAIEACSTVEEVATELANYQALIAAVKTAAQYEDEEAAALEQAKTAAKAELEGYKNADDYREAEQAQLATIISDGKVAIDAATSKAGVASALAAAKAQADALKTKAQYEEEEAQPEPEQPEKKGCGSSVVAASALISTLALAGFGLLFSRKRKQN